MPNLSTDALFILLKSLERAEKRNFKLYVTRNSASTDLKIIQLFDALDKMKDYDEKKTGKKKVPLLASPTNGEFKRQEKIPFK